jgi:hypothetical protein
LYVGQATRPCPACSCLLRLIKGRVCHVFRKKKKGGNDNNK